MAINKKIKNVGIDIVDKRKIELSIPFAKKILTEKEFEIFSILENDNLKLNYLGSKWSSKEAIYKAIDNNKIILTDIETLNYDNGKPYCSSHKNIVLSTSHAEFYTITIAIKLK